MYIYKVNILSNVLEAEDYEWHLEYLIMQQYIARSKS